MYNQLFQHENDESTCVFYACVHVFVYACMRPSVCVRACVCAFVRPSVYVCVCVSACVHVCMCVWVYACMRVSVRVCVSVCVRPCVCLCVRVCMLASMCACVCPSNRVCASIGPCVCVHVCMRGLVHARVCVVLLQHGAEPTIRNADGRTALDLAELSTKAVLTGEERHEWTGPRSDRNTSRLVLTVIENCTQLQASYV